METMAGVRRSSPARRAAGAALRLLARRAAGAYIAGERLEDALRVRERLARSGLAATIGFFDSPEDESAREVADVYLHTLPLLRGSHD